MKQYLCVGTYTEPILFGTGEVFQGKGKGIYVCEFEDGDLRILGLLELRNPSYLCIDEQKRKIYAVNETKEFQGKFGGGCTEVDYGDGVLKQAASLGTGGTDPCHIAISPDGSCLSVANFASGSVTVFPLDEQGHLKGEAQMHQHEGRSVHPVRQMGPHAHASVFWENGNLMYVPDLGLDLVKAYVCENGQVKPEPMYDILVPAGSGPRFGQFSRDGRHFYLIHELASQVVHFTCEDGKMKEAEWVYTLPMDFPPEGNICSDLHLTPDGRYLYASNRGHDSLCCYEIREDGSMKFLFRKKCGGKTPRNFCIDPSGKYLLVGNQDSDAIVVFVIEEDGGLTIISQTEMPSPVCIRFFQSGKNPLGY